MTQLIVRASDVSRREIHKNTQNTLKFGRNLINVCTTYLKLFSAIGAIYLP